MQDITNNLLDHMMTGGWFLNQKLTYTRPCAWDINCGNCELWAINASEKYGGEAIWLDTLRDRSMVGEMENMGGSIAHCVLRLNGRYYDSQDFEGVDDPRKLQVVRGVARQEYLHTLTRRTQ